MIQLPSIGGVNFRTISSPSGRFEVSGIPHDLATRPFFLVASKRGCEPLLVGGLNVETSQSALPLVEILLEAQVSR